MKLFGQNKYINFWDWFSANQETYMNMPVLDDSAIQADYTAVELLFDELDKRLKKINKYICFEFSPLLEDGSREFVISADGIRSAAQKVLQLVDYAPKLKNWKIIAFRQAKDIDHIEFEGLNLIVGDVAFNYRFDDENQVDLKFYVRGYDNADSQKINGALFVLVDSLIGEYNMMTKIGYIDVYDSKMAGKSKPRPLSELTALLESRKPNPIS